MIRNLPAGPLDAIRHAVEVGCASWSSQLQALRACAAAPLDALQAAAPSLAFAPEDLELLRELSELMEPFEEAFHLSRAEGRITASYVVPCIRGLRAHLEALRPSCRYVHRVRRWARCKIDITAYRLEFDTGTVASRVCITACSTSVSI